MSAFIAHLKSYADQHGLEASAEHYSGNGPKGRLTAEHLQFIIEGVAPLTTRIRELVAEEMAGLIAERAQQIAALSREIQWLRDKQSDHTPQPFAPSPTHEGPTARQPWELPQPSPLMR